jgi:hypothetical protein
MQHLKDILFIGVNGLLLLGLGILLYWFTPITATLSNEMPPCAVACDTITLTISETPLETVAPSRPGWTPAPNLPALTETPTLTPRAYPIAGTPTTAPMLPSDTPAPESSTDPSARLPVIVVTVYIGAPPP